MDRKVQNKQKIDERRTNYKDRFIEDLCSLMDGWMDGWMDG